jgi:hypothetical protein
LWIWQPASLLQRFHSIIMTPTEAKDALDKASCSITELLPFDAVVILGCWVEQGCTFMEGSGSGNYLAQQEMARRMVERSQHERQGEAIAEQLYWISNEENEN